MENATTDPKKSASTRGKRLLVVKRKKTTVKKAASGALPSFGQKRRPVSAGASNSASAIAATTTTTRQATTNSYEMEQYHGGDNNNDNDPFDDVMAALPNDCALGIQHLQNSPNMSLPIPLPSDPSRYIHAVLELHLYRKLQDSSLSSSSSPNHATGGAGAGAAGHDDFVSQQIADLLASNQIRKLTAPSRGDSVPLSVVLFTSDYERAARNTIVMVTVVMDTTDHNDGTNTNGNNTRLQQQEQKYRVQPDKQSADAVEWLIRQLRVLRGHRIAEADLKDQWRADPLPGSSLVRVLEILTRQQLLLGSSLERYYQLWLPTWGVVLQAWETARKKALTNLKRSYYKERSWQAMQQKYSPIPTGLLLDWMESVAGQVEMVDRAAGKFVRLVQMDNDDDDDMDKHELQKKK